MGSKIHKSNILTWNKIDELLSQYIVPIANQAPSVFYRYGNAADFIFSSLYPCWTWGNTILVIKPILGAAGREPHGSPPTHTRAGKADQELPLAFSLSTWHSQYMMQFSHTCPDLLIRSGQVKKNFLVRRASERAQEECSKFCLLERAPRRLLFFDFKLRKLFEGCALWIKCNRIVFFERVPLAYVGGVRK